MTLCYINVVNAGIKHGTYTMAAKSIRTLYILLHLFENQYKTT